MAELTQGSASPAHHPAIERDHQLRFGAVGWGDRSPNEAGTVSFSRPDARHSATGHARRRPLGQTKVAASPASRISTKSGCRACRNRQTCAVSQIAARA